MTKDHSHAHKAGPADIEHPVLDEATAAAETFATGETPHAASAESPVLRVIEVEAVTPAVIMEPGEPNGYTAIFFTDATPFAQKSLEIWEENLGALFGHMQKLAGVKSFEEAISLQTRFATDCFECFGRQSRDLVALSQQLASVGVAPLCGARPAAR
jgi:hypothetical protein